MDAGMELAYDLHDEELVFWCKLVRDLEMFPQTRVPVIRYWRCFARPTA